MKTLKTMTRGNNQAENDTKLSYEIFENLTQMLMYFFAMSLCRDGSNK